MRPLPLVLTVLLLLSGVAGQVAAGERPPVASDPYLTDWQRGGRHVEQSRYRDAIDAYKQYIEEVPKAVGARIYMGHAYEKLGQKEKAYQLYKDAASIYPDFAMDYFKEEIGPNKGIADALCGIGYAGQGNVDALEAYEEAIRVYPDHVEAHFRLGELYVDMGEKGYALEEYESLKRLDGAKASELQQMIAGALPAFSP